MLMALRPSWTWASIHSRCSAQADACRALAASPVGATLVPQPVPVHGGAPQVPVARVGEFDPPAPPSRWPGWGIFRPARSGGWSCGPRPCGARSRAGSPPPPAASRRSYVDAASRRSTPSSPSLRVGKGSSVRPAARRLRYGALAPSGGGFWGGHRWGTLGGRRGEGAAQEDGFLRVHHTSFSYTDSRGGDTLVGVPSREDTNLIADPLGTGHASAGLVSGDGTVGLYPLEVPACRPEQAS